MAPTREEIIQRMLANIDPKYDTSVGSFFYDLIAAIAIELEALYADQDELLDKYFVDTAAGDNLTKICAERGVYRKPATKANGTVTITGSVGATVNPGDKVASDLVTYTVTAGGTIGDAGKIDVPIEADVAGAIGNVPAGAIKYFPVTLPGVTAVTNTAAFANGYDEESDDDLRQRYYERVQSPATSGNANHYKQWAKEVTGIGDAKVFPEWNGAGTVKVVLIDANKLPASSDLVTEVTTHIAENRPIGATVTVISAGSVQIDVSATLTLAAGAVLDQVKSALEAGITAYLKSLAFVDPIVRYNRIAGVLLDTAGIVDYSNLQVNGSTANIEVGPDQVAVLGVVNVVSA